MCVYETERNCLWFMKMLLNDHGNYTINRKLQKIKSPCNSNSVIRKINRQITDKSSNKSSFSIYQKRIYRISIPLMISQ